MDAIHAFWHLANFAVPALATGSIAALLTKLLWRGRLKGVGWWRLARGAVGCSLLALVSGLVVFGHDGKMATYGAMVLACALALWSIGFVRRRR